MQRRADGAPGASMRTVRIERVKANTHRLVIFLAGYDGMLQHFKSRKEGSFACPGVETCNPAVHRYRTLWKGYAPALVWVPADGVYIFGVVEITESLEHTLRGRALRGELWSLTRPQPTADPAPVLGSFVEAVSVELPPPFDIKPIVQNVYGAKSILWGIANPVSPPLEMPAVELPPPLADQVHAIESEAPALAERLKQDQRKVAEQVVIMREIAAGKRGPDGRPLSPQRNGTH